MKRQIIDRLNKISGKYSMYEVFSDWIRCCSISISNAVEPFHDDVWKERERNYLDTIRRYTKEDRKLFGEMLGLLTFALEEKMEDILGQVYMESGMGSKAAGQFFTPYHLSELCAALVLPEPDENGNYLINEPSCGGGGMIIAAAAELKRNGINYQKRMKVVAQDLDWKGIYMCYLQLSLLGIDAAVIQGDSLDMKTRKKSQIYYTPSRKGIIL